MNFPETDHLSNTYLFSKKNKETFTMTILPKQVSKLELIDQNLDQKTTKINIGAWPLPCKAT